MLTKIVLLLTAVFVFNEAFSQWGYNEDPLIIKELKLTKLQQKEIKKINNDAKVEISFLKKNNFSTEEIATKADEINGARIKKIRNILTGGQQIIWRKKLMENKPRRGVTELPNERISH